VTVFDAYYDFRRQLVDALERDLVGPGAPDEVITDPPITRYVAGILFPRDAGVVDASQDFEPDDPGEDDAEGDAWDPSISMSYVRYPSSLGLTFAVSTAATSTIDVQVEAARYEPVERTGDTAPETDDAAPMGKRARPRDQPDWRRVALSFEPIRLEVTTPNPGAAEELEEGLSLFRRIRPADDEGRASVTLILINTRSTGSSFGRDADSYFQPRLRVTTEAGGPAFVHRAGAEPTTADEDVAAHRLLYRHAVSIATGHGVAVDWQADIAEPRAATEVWTCVVPTYELPLSDSNPDIPTDSLRMLSFAQGPREAALIALDQLCSQYDDWIAETARLAKGLEVALAAIANRHLSRCREAAQRMRAGVSLLRSDSDAWEAFRIANRAMVMQRARSDWLAGGDHASPPSLTGDHRWRPFQVAFILLCLPGIAGDDSPDREISDLLWFPTGGGKTEAYLGLLAFTTALRRLRDPDKGHGVTVIMRYTLRLLTIQQFDRAALLVCCLESIRREDSRLGEQPIEIGLWVGRGATPNSLAEAKVSIDKLRQGVRLEKSNPLQLHRCPWCADAITARNLWIAKAPPRLVMACRNEGCIFSDGLPVCVVDDDIYGRHPTLVIATADKFASMPWKDECRALFNADLISVPPPDLIIQDELHLISGPLGTLAGLYETAVDLLCTAQGRRPKVIASTATIRRADAQTTGLFDRDVRQFPPPGIDAADSFFAREASADAKGTRQYVGVTAPGTSQTTLLVRTYAALLQAVLELDGDPKVKDPYWTLVGYFNSLRVLGGARMQVQDDVNDRLELLAGLHGKSKREIPVDRRIELTSREPSGDIPDHLRRMDISLPDPETLGVILATNMISVGVDINRLGLMAVMGQPQSTSEYIQATSRVGRRFPGLVITMLNAAKSRDRSHYESYRDYHSALYRQVESSSVTPFSAQARSRALHAVFVALARLTVLELRANDGARRIAEVVTKLDGAKTAILERVQRVDPDEATATAAELEQIVAAWVTRAEAEPDLVYADQHHPDKALLGDAGLAGEDFQSTFPTLWSLRDVDLSSNLYQVV
jgi:hypothetical protein